MIQFPRNPISSACYVSTPITIRVNIAIERTETKERRKEKKICLYPHAARETVGNSIHPLSVDIRIGETIPSAGVKSSG